MGELLRVDLKARTPINKSSAGSSNKARSAELGTGPGRAHQGDELCCFLHCLTDARCELFNFAQIASPLPWLSSRQ